MNEDEVTVDSLFDEEPADADEDQLEVVKQLYEKRAQLGLLLTAALMRVEEYKADIRQLEYVDIPEMMDGYGIVGLDMADGKHLSVESYVYARVGHENADECHTWLQDNGHDSIIKDKVEFSLKKGQSNIAQGILATIKAEFDLEGKNKMSVHWKTLESWAKEEMEQGTTIPDCFEIDSGRRAKLK